VAVPTDSEIFLKMASIIKAVIPNMTLVLKGMEQPSIETVEEWLQFEMLASRPHVARRVNFYQHYSFQLIAFSLQSNLRSDKKANRHYELADAYKPHLHLVNYQIKSSCILFEEAKISYLDLRTATFTAKSISTGGTPSLDTLCAVILVDAKIDTPK
jgi:hypothetical protein